MKPSEVLLAAADYIEKWGWQRGSYGGRVSRDGVLQYHNEGAPIDGPCCVYGALYSVTDYDGDLNSEKPPELTGAEECLNNLKADKGVKYSLVTWNDRDAKDATEVTSLLREAATSCKGPTNDTP